MLRIPVINVKECGFYKDNNGFIWVDDTGLFLQRDKHLDELYNLIQKDSLRKKEE